MRHRLDVFLCIALAFGCLKGSPRAVPLGKPMLLEKDAAYSVAGTDVVLVNRGASMRTVLIDGDPNKEAHVFTVRLEVSAGGAARIVEVRDDSPVVIDGLRITADPTGFEWGKADGAVIVEAMPRG